MEKPCKVHHGSTNTSGYPQAWDSVQKKVRLAHVIVWEEAHGPKPEGSGVDIDHLCSNKRCVEITHLELVTTTENLRRAYARGERRLSDRCKNGHVYTPETTRLAHGYHGPYRLCLLCLAEYSRRHYAKRKSQTRDGSG